MGKSHMTRRGTDHSVNAMAMTRKSQQMRRWHLNNPWCRPILTLNYSALIIQRSLRRHASLEPKIVKIAACIDSEDAFRGGRQLEKYLARLDYYKITRKPRPIWIDDGYSSWCAVQIQSYWRMRRWNQRYKRSRMMIYQIAALTVQSAWRMFLLKRRLLLERSRKSGHEAALIIQACWRSYSCRRIYMYLRDLVCVTLKGAPSDLLRSIIPNESSFLDPASGTHVRFRLGGHRFPPEVYFKIFTHRPLCDVNSFAPRDYNFERKVDINASRNSNACTAGKAVDMGLGLRVGEKYFGASVITNVAIDKWYKRDEGNGWRPIASSKMNEFDVPPWLRGGVVCPSVQKVGHFHYSKLRRKIDMETQRKQRRRLWMMKAYRVATANRGPAYTESEDCQEPRIPRNEGPYVGVSSGSIKNRADADTVRHSNNWCPDYSSGDDDNSYEDDDGNNNDDDDEREGLREVWLRHPPSNPGSRIGTGGSLDVMRFNAVPASKQSARSVPTECARNDCEEDSEMLKWSLALDFNEYSAAWQSLGNSKSEGRVKVRHELSKAVSRTATAS